MFSNTEPKKATRRVKWRRPFATDTSGHMPTITSSPKGIVSPHDFPIGKTRIIYTATDHSGNSHSCVFTVTIVGEYFWKKSFIFSFLLCHYLQMLSNISLWNDYLIFKLLIMLFRKCHLFFLALYKIILTSYTNGENSDKRKFISTGNKWFYAASYAS